MHATLAAVAILCWALLLGAIARGLGRIVRLPETVLILTGGAATELLLARVEHLPHAIEALIAGRHVSAELIVLVFLPALIFESAFSLKVHAFSKNFAPVIALAAPAMLLAAAISAVMVKALAGPSLGWGWPLCLVFGALISATDPVAVVALLRELGAPKRLGLLIEGESLLNDGTAIVLFGILVALLGGGAIPSLGSLLGQLIVVIGGGVLVGLASAMLFSAWIGRIYDDPLREIGLSLVLAYATMIVAEAIHVSGVLALVSAGLYMAGPGRTRFSPQISGFLHHFWHFLAFTANSVIFFLVGAVVAASLGQADAALLGLTVAVWLGLIVVRFLVVLPTTAIANRFGAQRIDLREATVIAWGGLRGAVSLALALLVLDLPVVSEVTGQEVMTMTAGVAVLTILVNGSTTGLLLRRLGLVVASPEQRRMRARAELSVLKRTTAQIAKTAEQPELRTAPWGGVREQLEQRSAQAEILLAAAEGELDAAEGDRRCALWRQALATERLTYKRMFERASLGARALAELEHALDTHEDTLEIGGLEIPSRCGGSTLLGLIDRILHRLGVGFSRLAMMRLSLRYDLARAEAVAARAVRSSFEVGDDPDLKHIDATYADWERDAQSRLEDLRTNLPELAHAVEARLAERVAMQLERESWTAASRNGEIDDEGFETVLQTLRRRAKRLLGDPIAVEAPQLADLCAGTSLFAGLSAEDCEEIAALFTEHLLEAGDWLLRQGEHSRSLYLILRGAVEVLDEAAGLDSVPLITLGSGEVVGEMALLKSEPRSAGVRALTSCTLARLDDRAARRLLAERPQLASTIYSVFARRVIDDLVERGRLDGPKEKAARKAWLERGRLLCLSEGETLDGRSGVALMIDGELSVGTARPAIGEVFRFDQGLHATMKSWIFEIDAAP